MKLADIREKFLTFFESKGHTRVASSSLLVSADDPTLYFTNSGMVQFKDVFVGKEKRPYVRATTAQRCLRAGGKHNDLENVGFTARHHTFFEMLGNFSFGDYFKEDALKYAWELLTEVYKLPKDKLWATVYFEDDEAYDIWTKVIGLPADRVVRIGDNKGARYASDNFWQMADIGPCGPCSEIFYDHGPEVAGGPPGSPEQDGDRYIEIWNNVFMQFDRQPNGDMPRLPKPCVDTGMGLERLAAVLQHVHSNYEIDLFDNLIKAAARETKTSDLSHTSLRVIADHVRACAFLIADGTIPGGAGPAYVLRRIIRRAIRHGYKLGQKTPFFFKLVPDLVKEMGAAYPVIADRATQVANVLEAEETRFYETLENGMQILDAALAGGGKTFDGDLAFKLHDTFGFPLDLTADVCRERNVTVDEAGFNAAMEKQRENARAASKFKMEAGLVYEGAKTDFKGYGTLHVDDAKILALYKDGVSVKKIAAGETGVVVLDRTPFYAESGGQVGDKGTIFEGDECELLVHVDDVTKIQADVFGHHVRVIAGDLTVGEVVAAKVDALTRARTARNHSVTHIMHKALRTVLGDHVQQKGSLVDAEKTRFDFIQPTPMTDEQIRAVERYVNEEILSNTSTQAEVMAIADAQNSGAMMLFGEKYGDEVRVLSIGSSKELCGGTHVGHTGDIGFFKITSESGVAAGIRRVEAIAGDNAYEFVNKMNDTLAEVAAATKSQWQDVPKRIAQMQDNVKALEKELAALKTKLAAAAGGDLMSKVVEKDGVKFLSAEIEGADAKALREMVDQLKNKMGSGVILLGAKTPDGKVALCAGVTADLVGKFKAGDIVGKAAAIVGGKGGGRPDMAMAGGVDGAKLSDALASI
ncbi:MAG: alanine--tRNA ligase [Betaproteobacteria bacterium]|nr:MAG: alanine--tRNA ligase [Betaproteobacteria bacterium]